MFIGTVVGIQTTRSNNSDGDSDHDDSKRPQSSSKNASEALVYYQSHTQQDHNMPRISAISLLATLLLTTSTLLNVQAYQFPVYRHRLPTRKDLSTASSNEPRDAGKRRQAVGLLPYRGNGNWTAPKWRYDNKRTLRMLCILFFCFLSIPNPSALYQSMKRTTQ